MQAIPIHESAALLAATCWALSGVVSAGPVAHLGPLAFTRIRMTMVMVMLGGWSAISGGWQSITPDQLLPIAFSGAVGIFIGDTMLFMALNRLGPRRTSIIFSTNAPMSVLLGWMFLGEKLSVSELAGIGLVVAGVVLAIIFGKRRSQLHQWEQVKGALWIGIAFGLGAALSQAIGSLIARPVMETGTDPASVSALRVTVSVICFAMAYAIAPGTMRARNPLTLNVGLLVAFSGFIAMALGMTFVLFALAGGEVGIIATLSATSPAIILPMIWLRTGERPALGAWIGAALVIAGSALIFTS